MAFTGDHMTTSYKVELFQGVHDHQVAGNTFNMSLYTNAATLDATTTAYTATGEVVGTGYTATGQALTNIDATSTGTTAFVDFVDEEWTSSTITARGALIYNDTAAGDPSVSVHDFGSDQSSSSGSFTVVFPAAAAGTAVLRLA